MTALSDGTIREQIDLKRIIVKPFNATLIQPASLDVRLDRHFLVMTPHKVEVIEPYERQDFMTAHEVPAGEAFILHPGDFVLGSTFEYFELPDNMIGRVEGKSSVGRLGAKVHSTAGFIDPGFCGNITLEISSDIPLPIRLWPGMTIAQLGFSWLDQPAERPYGKGATGSKYANQPGPTASRYYLNPRPEGF